MGLTDRQLVDTFKQSASTMSGHDIAQFLIGNGLYKNTSQIQTQLVHAGFTKQSAATALNHKGPSVFQTFLQAGAGFLFVPGSVADEILGGGAATDATAGGSAAAGAGAGSAASMFGSQALQDLVKKYGGAILFLPLLKWLTTQRNWVRVLEYIGGAVMIAIAMRELAKQ